jgi:hypothetical protein
MMPPNNNLSKESHAGSDSLPLPVSSSPAPPLSPPPPPVDAPREQFQQQHQDPVPRRYSYKTPQEIEEEYERIMNQCE